MASITVSDDLYDRIERRLDGEFDSVDSYAEFALEEVMNRLEGRHDADTGDGEAVMDQLRDLGYLE